MSGTTDKLSGTANVVGGKIKQGVGDAIGSDKLEAEGIGQEAKGEAQKTVGDAKEAIRSGANKVADAINKKA